jgi:NAD(P)-dependent dehydrogenase (short-subunit alcohol dehydrogenase family)
LGGAGKRALAVVCDVTQDADVQQAVAAAVREFGRLDVAVANAGIGISGDFERLTLEQYRTVMETNVFGVIRTVRAALDELKKTRGRVAIIGSVSGIISTPGTSAYCASKFAVRALALALRDELARDGISVTHIAPGLVESEIRLKDNSGAIRLDAKDPAPAWLVMPAETAARQIVRAIARRKAEVVITFHGKLAVFLQRFFPWMIAAISRKLSDKRPPNKEERARN